MTIVVHVPSDGATAAYADECTRLMRQLASDPGSLEFKVHPTDPTGSGGHADSLQRIVAGLDNTVVNIICDSDTAVVMQGWDQVTLASLSHHDCLATQYDTWDRFPHRGDRIQSYKGRPHFVWAALAPGKPWNLLDFGGTDTRSFIPIDTVAKAELYGLPHGEGFLVGKEAGWRTVSFWHDNNVSFKLLDHSRTRQVLGDLPLNHEQYDLGGRPFVVHQRSSRKVPYRQGPSAAFYSAVDRYLK